MAQEKGGAHFAIGQEAENIYLAIIKSICAWVHNGIVLRWLSQVSIRRAQFRYAALAKQQVK